ncbi:RagB/SusD family nutrient uptake outer membrane protein [Niabella beijingensis]|uniref:RagB/SusD family nutrient uptake outer membrane protein n=1 Tax=Niabella beijingensis TaxID=2872700 RepID=UPI001CC1A56D|nr:RagB/SusD family nutrient uptake outer membrane protein [Niabella beijingensis]MBZ4189880.1 RagB/SusD family nutrient uptake outer membrane protein [Niabella beijingensis]
MKLRHILAVSGILLMATSCGKKLDLYPSSAMAPQAVTSKDLPALRVGMYNDVQNDPGVYSFILFDLLGGDIHTASNAPIDLINNILSPLNSMIAGGWNGYYSALFQVNNVIGICESMEASENRNRTLGEAHYFRALIYYNLLTRWGAVPVLKKNTLEKPFRDPVPEVWKFIEEELNAASALLSSAANYYYVSADAATALKARVLLSQGKKTEAATLAEGLITSGKYQLDAFEKIFRKQTNTEIIFAFENLSEESSNNISDLFYTYAHPNKGQGSYRVSQQLVNAYSGTDKRKEISIINIAGTDCVNKYPSGQTGKDPVIISRIAEMYLISAEAQGRVDGLARLNQLRSYRGLQPVSAASDDQYTSLILEERRLELMGENFRFYDLVRTGRAVPQLGIKPHQALLPIPGRELQYNTNLQPNPGY